MPTINRVQDGSGGLFGIALDPIRDVGDVARCAHHLLDGSTSVGVAETARAVVLSGRQDSIREARAKGTGLHDQNVDSKGPDFVRE